MNYKPTIGLEIHAELKTHTKMFCDSPNDPDERHPNVNVCPICMGHPGVLPVINKAAVEAVVRTGLALHSEIAQFSKFDRKNYFYPDLPKGYQISQYDLPLCKGGCLEINGPLRSEASPLRQGFSEAKKKVDITRVHLEEDTARLQHDPKTNSTLVDFNRAGVPLMELVTEPDITSGSEAGAFARELQLILRYLGVSDADMEKGQMRVEVNISLQQNSSSKTQISKGLGTKVEIKNLNSFRSVEQAVDYEIKRQGELLEKGEKIVQETRGWDETKQVTISQRFKEKAQDYRYFPEPDLPPLTFKPEDIEKLKTTLPELPEAKRQRFTQQFNLPSSSTQTLVANRGLAAYFENVISELEEWFKEEDEDLNDTEKQKLYKLTANYLITDLQKLLYENGMSIGKLKIIPENFAEYVKLIHQGKITSRVAKDILLEMFNTAADPSHIIESAGLQQISDEAEIQKMVEEVIIDNPKPVEDYKNGKAESLQFLLGQVMKASKGKVNPQKAQVILKRLL